MFLFNLVVLKKAKYQKNQMKTDGVFNLKKLTDDKHSEDERLGIE